MKKSSLSNWWLQEGAKAGYTASNKFDCICRDDACKLPNMHTIYKILNTVK